MIVAVSILCVLTLLLEEAYLRLSGFGRGLPLWAANIDGPTGEEDRLRRQVLHYRVVKLVQFGAFGLLWILAGGRAGSSLMTSSFGQITTQLLLMQVLRVLGRHVTSNRVFLTVLGVQQAFLALAVPFLEPMAAATGADVHPVDWLSGAALTLALLALAVSFSAAMVYFMRLMTRSEKRVRSTLPPLASSELLARKACSMAIPCLAGTALLMLIPPIHIMQSLAVGIASLPAPVALVMFFDRRKLHHPAANLLVAVSYPLLLGTVFAGMTAML